ncbi:DoxX family protein [Nocardia sp. BMG111209]|uniref:DoxX family protein n=1 Tax=Nocardia sp. BMG111209 TaxID=1160137 RepID=UPI0003638106|nr:DoxX family protein [Nocardia sp. BMG111209]
MAPLVVLLVVTAIARLAGWLHLTGWLDSWPHAARLGLAAMFLLTGIAHFTEPRRSGLIAMVPPRLPAAATLVTVTGILEFAGAAGLLIPPVAPVAAICLAVLLLVMFPANVRAARADLGIKSMPLPLRTVVQVVFLGACVLAAL